MQKRNKKNTVRPGTTFSQERTEKQTEVYDSVTTQVTHEALMETFTKDFVETTEGKVVKVMHQYLFLDCQGQVDIG